MKKSLYLTATLAVSAIVFGSVPADRCEAGAGRYRRRGVPGAERKTG